MPSRHEPRPPPALRADGSPPSLDPAVAATPVAAAAPRIRMTRLFEKGLSELKKRPRSCLTPIFQGKYHTIHAKYVL